MTMALYMIGAGFIGAAWAVVLGVLYIRYMDKALIASIESAMSEQIEGASEAMGVPRVVVAIKDPSGVPRLN